LHLLRDFEFLRRAAFGLLTIAIARRCVSTA